MAAAACGCHRGLYPTGSKFNHDCAPNVVKAHAAPPPTSASAGAGGLPLALQSGCQPPAMVFTATRDVAARAACCISYVPVEWPAQLRRADLAAQFKFDCGCARCAAELAAPPPAEEQ